MRTSTYHKKNIYRVMEWRIGYYFSEREKFEKLRYYFQKYEESILREKEKRLDKRYNSFSELGVGYPYIATKE